MLSNFLKKPLTLYILASFFLLSWPFFNYPFTDGDINNWVWVAQHTQETHQFLTGPNDQTHGPLMAWTGAIFSKFNAQSFYLYALFSILCGVLSVYLTYFFTEKLTKKKDLANINTFLITTTLAPIYLARTPMYDWPAAVFYFMFCGFYLLYLKENKKSYLITALIAVGIGSLARFSICMGLSGIFMILVNLVSRRSIFQIINHGLLILFSCLAINAPWIYGQYLTHGNAFIDPFIYDNLGRFVKSTRVNAKVRKDYYGFLLYTLVGLIPYTFAFLASIFQKGISKKIKENEFLQYCLCGFLPCLLIFSFSGHTKLARYIAYVFPMCMMFCGTLLYTDLKRVEYRKRTAKIMLGFSVFIALLLSVEAYLFIDDVKEGLLFTLGTIFLIFTLIALAYHYLIKKHTYFLTNAHKSLLGFILCYTLFFSILTYESFHAQFLIDVREKINKTLSY